ncbi:hypothetical protein C8F01DRAFT_1228972 [Mycena amicta]|nr:hypothetical protein C8F01DRAFT_1228972 [Mycena amicta]
MASGRTKQTFQMDPGDFDNRICPICSLSFKARGIGFHVKSCTTKAAARNLTAAFAEDRRNNCALDVSPAAPEGTAVFDEFPEYDAFQDEPPSVPNDDEMVADYRPQKDDIKREFHPSSGLPPQIMKLDEYLQLESRSLAARPPPVEKPWEPGFKTRLDFEVAEFVNENMLNKKATETLISLIRRIAANINDFTIRKHTDMDRQWTEASKRCTNFEKFDVPVQYKGDSKVFEMHARPLWRWTLDLVQDPRLAPFLFWDAEQRFRYNGQRWVPFYTEPWTASAYWEAQSQLNNDPDAKICPYILYADKAKLSSFGTQKGYPIIARLGNVAVGIRNGTGWGGGQIVGWLPVVADDTQEKGKPGYTNFKMAVWHESFYQLLESIEEHSKFGSFVRCGDGKSRKLFPMILILAADYEEATVMALIRGVKSNFPCPVCLVKAEDLSNLGLISPLRTAGDSETLFTSLREPGVTAAAREEGLKKVGLRNVENVFWSIGLTDPHHANSFDRLHSHQAGLFGDHLFGQVKLHLEHAGPRQSAAFDKQFDALPRWRNLNHFSSVSNIHFNDGKKYCDIGKMIVFAAHNLLEDELGLLLLECIRSYVVLDIYLALEVQTDETVAEGRQELQKFGKLIEEYSKACIGTPFEKNWNFPKIHLQLHMFDDILRKGAAKNFGTKIDESMHGPARAAYLTLTNKKDVAPQILRFIHRSTVGTYIREQLDDLDVLDQQRVSEELNENGDDAPEVVKEVEPEDVEPLGNTSIGSIGKNISFAALEAERADDVAFRDFRARFSTFLSNFLVAFGHRLPNDQPVKFLREQEVRPCGFLKVYFKSLDNWLDTTDYLRCSPSFHGQERYDAALVQTPTGIILARLLFIFTCKIDQRNHPFALVQALDANVRNPPAKDKALGFRRVRAKPRRDTEFISVHSIIRGALLAPAFDREGEYLVVDDVDTDMFFRLKSM